MNQSSILQLTRGAITNHDEITVILIEPTDGTPALVRVQWPPRITTAAAAHYPAVAAAIVRIIAESATELAGIKGSPTAIDAHEKSPGESPGLLPFPAEQTILSVSNKRSIRLGRRDPRLSGTRARTLPTPTNCPGRHFGLGPDALDYILITVPV